MTPPIVKKLGILKLLNKPIDFNKKFLSQPIFGFHKTWRGVIFGIIIGMLVTNFQFWLYQFSFFKKISFLDYQKINILFFSFLISFGAILGDLFFAFIKRRLKMEPGKRFLPFDQTNYVISNAFILTPIFKLNVNVWLTLFVLTFFLHIIFNRLGFCLGIHKSKW